MDGRTLLKIIGIPSTWKIKSYENFISVEYILDSLYYKLGTFWPESVRIIGALPLFLAILGFSYEEV